MIHILYYGLSLTYNCDMNVMMSKNLQSVVDLNVKEYSVMSKREEGFSLLELLIALFVFALVSGFAYRSVNMLMEVTDTVSAEEIEFSELQRSFLMLERDLRSALKVEELTSLPEGEAGFSFAMADSEHENVAALASSIRYVLRDKALYRQAIFDEETPGTLATLLLNDVESLGFTAINSGELSGVAVEISHGLLGRFQRHMMMLFQPATNVAVLANLDTLTQVLLAPSSVGGEILASEDEEPVVLDQADIVADGW